MTSARSVRPWMLALSAFSLLIALAPARPALAVLIELNDRVFGQDAVTFDTDTRLKWLDITLSTNRSFNDVASQFDSGGDFEGWRHATAQELFVFWDNAGIVPHVGLPTETIGFSVSPEVPVRDWVTLIGDTNNTAFDGPGGRGVVNTPFENGLLSYEARLDGCGALAPPGACRGATTFSGILLNQAAPELGHYLVRPIPEPGAALLFGIGFGVVSVATRRRRLN